jgi:hypothetical protein
MSRPRRRLDSKVANWASAALTLGAAFDNPDSDRCLRHRRRRRRPPAGDRLAYETAESARDGVVPLPILRHLNG